MNLENYSKKILELNMQIEQIRNEIVREVEPDSDLERQVKKKIINELNISITMLLILCDTLMNSDNDQAMREMFETDKTSFN